MCEKYSRSLLRISVAQICQNLGWNSAQSSSLEVLTDVLEKYILKIGGTCRKFSEQYGHTEANLNDLGLAFQHLGISLSELEDYVHHVEPVPFAHEVVAFPATKTSNLGFPNPRSREILQHREEHIPEYMPYMFPNMKDEIPENKVSSPLHVAETALKGELNEENGDKDDVNIGEKRPTTMSTPELPSSKRPRFGNSNLPDEAGHSQYEMTCVFMGPNGVLTTRQGCQGRLPEPRMPPPNPRTLNENKENSGKTKDSATGLKIATGVGGIGADNLTSVKNEGKKSRKSPQKRKTLHGLSAKLSSDDVGSKKSFKSSMDGREPGKKSTSKTLLDGAGKEIGKKSVSSKAAAKFLKKLKLSKKSSKLFTKSKIKDQKMSDFQRDDIFPEKTKKLVIQTNEETKRRREKKSAEVVDSDEELRNLVTPSSSQVPSPDQPVATDTEGGAKIKARLDAINDSINTVLREGPIKGGKIRRRKKKDVKSEETIASGDSALKGQSDGKPPEPKVKRKPGRPPKIQKPPEPPPPVDVKPFVSDKYSSEELQVYEFNDSPPDTSISSRRPSAAESVTPVASSLPPPQPPPPPPQLTVKHEQVAPTTKHTSAPSSSSHKFHRRIIPEDDLFAPEIKIESRIDHSDSLKPLKLELSKDKEKPKVKEEKKERVEEEKGSHKSKDDKGDRRKDKKERGKDERDRSRDDREKHKEKEHRRDKKDKKKEKDKKRRHKSKELERDKEKEKEKKPEEKVKQESRESRESSPSVGVGVKLKIKIGGSAGTPTSMMVTGEGSSPASPAPTHGSKRESMSPPRVVPKLYISKKGQGVEEKSKKTSKPIQRVNDNKHKMSPLAVSVKSQPASPSSSKASPSPRSTPTPPVPRKTPTPPPNPKSTKSLHSPHSKSTSSKQKDSTSATPAKERPSRSPIKDKTSKSVRKKKERKPSLSSLSSMSSSSLSPAKSPFPRRQTPPQLARMSSSSPEKSPAPLPFQSPTPSPRTSSSAARSPSRTSTPHRSPTPPPSLSRRKPTPTPPAPPPPRSPSGSPHHQSHSPPPTRPPTPGSTSPPPSPDWNLPVSSPSHPRSPTPTPRTPTASPSRHPPSPAHSSQPGSPHRSPSPTAQSSSRPGSRLLETPEPRPHSKDMPSPASSGKSSTSGFKTSRTVEAETVCVFYDDHGQKVWICPACKLPDDGSEMIGCDMCDNWYHWPCVGIHEAPPEEQQWFCCKCLPKTKSSSRGRGRPRGRGRGRGRKKIT